MWIPMAARCCFLSEGDRADAAVLRTLHSFSGHGRVPCNGCDRKARYSIHCRIQSGNLMESVPHMETAPRSAECAGNFLSLVRLYCIFRCRQSGVVAIIHSFDRAYGAVSTTGETPPKKDGPRLLLPHHSRVSDGS